MIEEPRIGVFVCHCGLNIAGVIDVEALTEYAKTLPHVVYAEHNRYMCADTGQNLIKEAIKKYKLNRVIVAACSPRLHEPTFRRCVSEAGLNPYLLEMANIREHCSWCHSDYPEKATEKAKDILRMAVARAALLQPLTTIKSPVTKRALVIGGGITGINVALSLANMGFEVHLVEKNPSIGGHMAQLDKTFPTLDCSACILTPKMVDVSRHPNIKLYTYSEVVNVEGYVGNYKVRILKKPRYVDESKCTGCGVCAEHCPIEVPNEFDMGLKLRKAIYVPFPQAVPLKYTIDIDNCIRCGACERVCQAGAVNYEQKPEEVEIEVGVIIVAIGFDIYEPYDLENYGYGKYADVITGLHLERLLNAAGPTGGNLMRISDGKLPKRVVFIHCVGSRDINKYEYCSGFCCMYSVKNAILIKERYENVDIYMLYTDLRAPFKGYEEFYRKAKEMGIKFIRVELTNRRVEKNPETGSLKVYAKDEDGNTIEIEADLIVLATAAIPRIEAEEVSRVMNISRGRDGFFLEAHPKLRPVDTPTSGVFIAGACQGLKDIPYSVSQGAGAAARAATILCKDEVESEAITAEVDPEKCIGCGLCVDLCPFKAPIIEKRKAKIRRVLCMGCGVCAASCPRKAITMKHFTDKQILVQIEALFGGK